MPEFVGPAELNASVVQQRLNLTIAVCRSYRLVVHMMHTSRCENAPVYAMQELGHMSCSIGVMPLHSATLARIRSYDNFG